MDLTNITQAEPWTAEEILAEAREWGYEGTDVDSAGSYLLAVYAAADSESD